MGYLHKVRMIRSPWYKFVGNELESFMGFYNIQFFKQKNYNPYLYFCKHINCRMQIFNVPYYGKNTLNGFHVSNFTIYLTFFLNSRRNSLLKFGLLRQIKKCIHIFNLQRLKDIGRIFLEIEDKSTEHEVESDEMTRNLQNPDHRVIYQNCNLLEIVPI